MAFILTPAGISTSEGVPIIMDSPTILPDGIVGEAAAGAALFNQQLESDSIASEFTFGSPPRFVTTYAIEGFEDG
jgi:hypothetical protein